MNLFCPVLQPVRQSIVDGDVEKFSQDVHPIAGFGFKERFELSLRQQNDLPELRRSITKPFRNGRVNGADLALGKWFAGAVFAQLIEIQIRHVEQPRFVLFFRFAASAFGWAHLVGSAHHPVAALTDAEDQFDLRQNIRFCMIGS